MPTKPPVIVQIKPRKRAGSYKTFERRYDPVLTNDDTIYRHFDDPMVSVADENQVWTIVSGDNGAWYIVPGKAFVNREYYVITRKGWSNDELLSPGYRY